MEHDSFNRQMRLLCITSLLLSCNKALWDVCAVKHNIEVQESSALTHCHEQYQLQIACVSHIYEVVGY
jgi:hypothetical protein